MGAWVPPLSEKLSDFMKKRIFILFAGGLAALFGACDSGESETDGREWFLTPESTVNGTTVELRCATKFGDGVLNDSNAGFLYAVTDNEGLGAFETASEVRLEGSTLCATLSGLQAETIYVFYAYADLGTGRMQSVGSAFRTGDSETLPDPEPDPEGPTKYSGWAELPVEVASSELYYAYHICPDFRVDGHPARNYTVCYSAEHHCPVWVAAPRHACYEVEGTDRTDAYGKDPDIPSDVQYNSKETGGGCNKGHMLGSAERTCTAAVNRQVFYYTNIAPQYSDNFNNGGGAWNNLESFVDGQVCADTTYVVVGTYFETFTDAYGKSCSPATISFGGRSDVTRPSMFYYLLLRSRDGNTGKSVYDLSTEDLQCAAFVLRHNMEKGHRPQAEDMMSVSELEELTGFTFFANVPNAPKDRCNPSDWGL